MTDDSQLRDHQINLEGAIHDLQTFAAHNRRTSSSLTHSLHVEDDGHLTAKPTNPLSTALTLLSCIFSAKARNNQLNKRNSIERHLSKSIQCILRHPINDASTSAIEMFNDAMEKKRQINPFMQVIRQLLKKHGLVVQEELNPIQLRRTACLKYTSIHQSSEHSLLAEKISSLSVLAKEEPSVDSNFTDKVGVMQSDSLYMKALSILRSTAFYQTLQSNKPAPQHTFVLTSGNDLMIRQTYEPFPGELIALFGKFPEQTNTALTNHKYLLDRDSVRVDAAAEQQGFPLHPSQHTGFALSYHLIAHPYDSQRLPNLHSLLQKKEKMAHALLPGGEANAKAKGLLKQKREIFNSNSDHYISLHHKLALAMIEAAQEQPKQVNAKDAIDAFFHALNQKRLNAPSPYIYLSDIYHRINEHFIARPCQAVHRHWLSEQHPDLLSHDPIRRLLGCRSIFMRELDLGHKLFKNKDSTFERPLDEHAVAYISMMGLLLGEAACNILLQQLSEKLQFIPPSLKTFDKLCHACLYEQLCAFTTELDTSYYSGDVLTRQIENEINIFKGIGDMSLCHLIVKELEIHYNPRNI